MQLLPEVKKLEIEEGFLPSPYIAPFSGELDSRLKKVIDLLPCGENGTPLTITCGEGQSESYALEIRPDAIVITSDGVNGVFYALQTLRQIFRQSKIPCLKIEDAPDFAYRGVYHDVTRGKIPTVSTLKKLIDKMAYFKMNSLQLYVEHTFEFEETKELVKKTGCLTREDILELDAYCYENFIEFIPSVATFGHMYEILEQEPYRHLRVCKDFVAPRNPWGARMRHHTIDPLQDESLALVKSLIDQYAPLYKTDVFNICGDETFDLMHYGEGVDSGELYTTFVLKIINHLRSKHKLVMMWADIVLKHPEQLGNLPDDICFLNWEYGPDPSEEKVKKLCEVGKKQIVCPGTSSWSRFCEDVAIEEKNITRLIDLGYKYGALGVLNTNWGDYGNPSSLELAMYGLVLGGVKAWRVSTKADETLYAAMNSLLYGGENAMDYVKRVSLIHSKAPDWAAFSCKYAELRYGTKMPVEFTVSPAQVEAVQTECLAIIRELSSQKWEYDEAREELILCARSLCALTQLAAKTVGTKAEAAVSVKEWVADYKTAWLAKNKASELYEIEEIISYVDSF